METFVYGLNQASPNLRTVLTRLCRLYGVYNILQHTGDYLQVGLYDRKYTHYTSI